MALETKRTLAYAGVAITCAVIIILAGISFFPESAAKGSLTSSQGTGGFGFVPELQGSVLVNATTGAGIINLQVRGSLDVSVIAITVIGISPLLSGSIDNLTFTYNGTTVSQANPLPSQGIAAGIGQFSSDGQVNRSYSITVAATTANGEVTTDSASIAATAMIAGSDMNLAFSRNGSLVVDGLSGNGTMTMTIFNNLLEYGDVVNTLSITSVTFSTLIATPASTSGLGANTTSTGAAITGLVLTHEGKQVSQENPLVPGDSASGSITVAGVKTGGTYQVNFVMTFNNGASLTGALEITAQT